MTADQLRQALDVMDSMPVPPGFYSATILDAARFWLNLLEGDETIIKRIATILDGMPDSWYAREYAEKVLAAIVGEET